MNAWEWLGTGVGGWCLIALAIGTGWSYTIGRLDHTPRTQPDIDADDADACAFSAPMPPVPETRTDPPVKATSPRRAPSPAPGPPHGGCDMTIRMWHDGCIHYYGPDGHLVDIWPDPSCRGLDWDRWLKDITR